MSINIPLLKIDQSDLENLVKYIYKHEYLLKEFGYIKIELEVECLLALKKRHVSPQSTTNQLIKKIGKNQSIYSIEQTQNIYFNSKQEFNLINEDTFWFSLSQPSLTDKYNQTSISILQNKTFFYEKRSRKYFSIHKIPRQSLLKLGGTKLTDQFTSTLSRSDGQGAIYPLSINEQHLSSLIYHHEGAPRHWYIIQHTQIESIRKIISQENNSICIEHDQLLIDPSVLDKNNIRYEKIIQYPNQFIILSAGVLSQSFTEYSSWSESISFALPSWIQDGHAYQINSICQCFHNIFHPNISIDFNLFKDQLINKFINTHLNQNTNVLTVPSTEANVSSVSEQSSSIISPISNSFLNEDNHENNLQIDRIMNYSNERCVTKSRENDFDDFLSKLCENELYPINRFVEAPINIDQNKNPICLFDDLMDITPLTTLSSHSQTNQTKSINISTKRKNASWKKKRKFVDYKTLFVSGLRHDINKNDIYKHFIGSTKVIIKQCQTVSNLKYAFISHRTKEQAQRNLDRSIDKNIFGLESHVEYASNSQSIHKKSNDYDNRTIVVKNIPTNINENHLRSLFKNSYISKFSPAKIIQRNSTSTKTLWGYAFIVYDNIEQANYVIQHSDQYFLNGQKLVISFYSNQK